MERTGNHAHLETRRSSRDVITKIMKLICPTLDRDEKATPQNIEEIVSLLENKEDPFLILQKDEMTYIQTLWTPEGYDMEYQEGNIFEHYWLSELANKNDIIWAFQNYLKYQPYWKTKFKFEKKDIATLSYKIGHKMGYFLGKIARLFS